MDPFSICASAANIAQLAGTIVHKLAVFCEAASHVDVTVSGFTVEITNFQTALWLVSETKNKLQTQPMHSLEQNHWACIGKLLVRCTETLERLRSLLDECEARQTAFGRKPLKQLRLNMRSQVICILRSHIRSYTQALQISLSTLTLVSQSQSHASIGQELDKLTGVLQGVNATLRKRPKAMEDVEDANSVGGQHSVPSELQVKADVEQLIESATALSDAAVSGYQTDAESALGRLQTLDPPIDRWMDDLESPLQNPNAASRTAGKARSPGIPRFNGSVLAACNELRDSGLGSDELSEDDNDPDPGMNDHFSEDVLTALVQRFHQQALDGFEKGNYHRAENAQKMMIRYLDEGRRNHGMTYDNAKVFEQLALIYYKQKQFDDAKSIYSRLLEEHKERVPDVWRWYFYGAKMYHEQDKLQKAALWAKRAFSGAERCLPKGDPFISEAVTLFTQICQQRGEHLLAEALRKQYLGDEPRPPGSAEHMPSLEPTSCGSNGRAWLLEAGHDPASPMFDAWNAMKCTIERDSPVGAVEVLHHFHDVGKQRELAKEGLKWAIQGGRRAIMNLLIELDYGIAMDSLFADGKTPLIHAIQVRDDGMVQDLLQKGVSLEMRCAKGITPLIHAVTTGHEPITALLLGKGARVDDLTYGCTALHRAVSLRFAGLVKLLLEHDANIECMAPRKFTIPRPLDASWTPLLLSSFAGSSEVTRLLLEGHAHVEAKTSTGATALMYAAEESQLTTVRLLLSNGADVHAADKKGDTALHRAVRKGGNMEIIDAICGKGGSLDTPNKERETTLHIAACRSDGLSLLMALIERGASIEASDIAGRTPLHVAIEKRQRQNVLVLLGQGADIHATDKYGQSSLKLAQRSSPEIQMDIKRRRRATSAAGPSVSQMMTNNTDDSAMDGRANSGSSKFTFFRRIK